MATFIIGAAGASAAECSGNPVLFMADVSGSMRDESAGVQTQFASGIDNDGKNEKVELVQELLYRLTPDIAGKNCQTGILLVRYLSGDPNAYSTFMRVDSHGPERIKKTITTEFAGKFPVFNRRTPLADALRALDRDILDPVSGKMTIVLISDGKDSFHNHDKDMAHTEISSDDKVFGPVSEVKRLMTVYGNSFRVHTVYVADRQNVEEDEGRYALEMMAAAGKGGSAAAVALLEDDRQLADFAARICCQ